MSTQRPSRVPRKRRSLSELPPVGASDAADNTEPGMLLVISGPSGVGKDTVWQEASKCLPSFAKTITCTTRRQRPGEEEGVTYFFVSDDEFDTLIEEDELLEWAEVHGNRYGVPAALVLQRLEQGLDVVCVIDVQGARRIRSLFMTRALLIFVKPPENRDASDVLKERLESRGGENSEEIETRLQTANWELSQTELFDVEVVNDDVSRSAQEICEIVQREKSRRSENG
jgi:guanylate kinase